MKIILFLCICIELILPSKSFATDDSHKLTIERLLITMGMDKRLSKPGAWNNHVADQFKDWRRNSANKKRFDDALKNLSEFYTRVITWEKAKPDIVELYMSLFSEKEAIELIQFFKTKVGQKFIAVSDRMAFGEEKINRKILEQYEDEHKKLFNEIMRASNPAAQ